MKPVDPLSDDEFARLVQKAAAMPDAPPALIRAAIDQWRAAQRSLLQSAARAILNRVAAALTFDSWAAGSLAFGVRAVPSQTRHLLFTAMGRDIDVRIAPAAGHFQVTGQILGPDDSGVVELACASDDDEQQRAGLVHRSPKREGGHRDSLRGLRARNCSARPLRRRHPRARS